MPPETAPLKGLRIAITRERGRAQEMAELFTKHGATPVSCPMITFRPPENWKGVDEAISTLSGFSWVVFTSINGVAYFCERMIEKGKNFNELKGRRVACVGESTAAELHKYGLSPDYIPEEQSSEELLAALSRMVKLSGQKLLLPRGDLASPLLREGLRKQGAQVADPIVYRNVPDPEGGQALRAELESGHVDVLCFSSPSAATNALKALGARAAALLENVRIYSIGPMTSRALSEAGVRVAGEAKQHDMPGLVDAVVKAESGRAGK